MEKVTAFDIETIPNEDLIGELEPIEPPKNYKDPDKISKYIEQGKAEQIQKMALSPFYGRVCCYSFQGSLRRSEVILEHPDLSMDVVEKQLVNETLQCLQGAIPLLVTWNGIQFDLWFLYVRALVLGINLPFGSFRYNELSRRYVTAPHCDLMQVLAGWDRQH